MEQKNKLEMDRESIITVINSPGFDEALAKSIEVFANGLQKEGGKRLATYQAMKAAGVLFLPRLKNEYLLMQDRQSTCTYAQRELIRLIGRNAVREVLLPILEKKENTLPKRTTRTWKSFILWVVKLITKIFKSKK